MIRGGLQRLRRGSGQPAAGFALLTVLIVIMLSSMVAVSLLYATKAETTAQAAGIRGDQAWAAAMSGIHRALALAESAKLGDPAWMDNAASLRHQEVVDDGADRWYFSIWSRSDSEATPVRFGLSDEASRLNVGMAPSEWLDRLPGFDTNLTETVTDIPSFEASLPPEDGYPENPPLEEEGNTNAPPALTPPSGTVAAVLAERGLDAAAMFGEDMNHNLRMDPNEDDGESLLPTDNQDGLLDAGLQEYLTSLSYEPNVDPQGNPRVNLNDAEATLAGLGLPPATLSYIEALRRAGQQLNHVADLLEAEASLPNEQGNPVQMQSGVGGSELPGLLERCSTTDATTLAGLVNVSTAQVAVLQCLPGLDEALAESIVTTRGALGPDELSTTAWLFTRGLLTTEQFRQVAPHVTSRSYQFRFHCVGYGLPSGRYRVVEVVIDVASEPARVVSIRDLTSLGFPLPLDLLETDENLGGSVRSFMPGRPRLEPAGGGQELRASTGHQDIRAGVEHDRLAGRPKLSQTSLVVTGARGSADADRRRLHRL